MNGEGERLLDEINWQLLYALQQEARLFTGSLDKGSVLVPWQSW
jgi:hypothetical protein